MSRTWDVLDYGKVQPGTHNTILYEGECGHEAELPVMGRVIAITQDGGIIFDIGENNATPNKIRCRRCGRVYGNKYAIQELTT